MFYCVVSNIGIVRVASPSCSIESKAFVEAVDQNTCSAQDKYTLLQRAAGAQSGYARAASQGEGVDRHLLGLKLCVEEGEAMPAIFADPKYGESSHWRLSTSSLASDYFVTWGFGEVVADGYGVGYMVKKNNLAVTVTSRHLGAKAFADAIEKALRDMRAMCQEAMAGGKAKL